MNTTYIALDNNMSERIIKKSEIKAFVKNLWIVAKVVDRKAIKVYNSGITTKWFTKTLAENDE